MIEECNAYTEQLASKAQSPGQFHYSDTTSFQCTQCDLGASVSLMALSVCMKLEIGELKPTTITSRLADSSVKHSIGMFFILTDFVVLEMEEDSQIPIILSRPFLATAGAIIDVKNGNFL